MPVDLKNAPKGIVTIVFTDIEESSKMTRLLTEREGAGTYETHLRDPHRDRLLEEAAARCGREVQCAGDGHMLVFPKVDDAIAAMVAFQQFLDNTPITYTSGESTFRVRVRIGIHTTEKEVKPTIDTADRLEYPGTDTNFAARIGSLGAGGQILISEESERRYSGPRGELSFHRWEDRSLKSFEYKPQTIYEILYRPGQQPREPGVRFFPAFYLGERNRYIERPEKEREVLDQFCSRRGDGSTSRFVRLWGEGGMGKTRLGIACAAKLAGLFEGGVYFVDLGSSEPSREAVVEAIARALGLPAEVRNPDALAAVLKNREDTLLLLDNVEVVSDKAIARDLARLATDTRGINLLVMSRDKLGASDVEQIISLNEGMDDDECRSLFLARAWLQGQLPGKPTAEEATQIMRIFDLTERIPLAIELAASWIDEASLKEIADGLEATPLGDFSTPPDGVATNERHAAMERSLQWSFDLIGRGPSGPAHQRTFAACSLFAAPFTADAVSAIVEHIARSDLTRLHRTSLVRRDSAIEQGTSRYFLHRFTRRAGAYL